MFSNIYFVKFGSKNYNSFLLSNKNTDENKCHSYKIDAILNEDYIFIHDSNNMQLSGCRNVCEGPLDYYKTGTMRIVEYYNNLDLYKIKANWKLIEKFDDIKLNN